MKHDELNTFIEHTDAFSHVLWQAVEQSASTVVITDLRGNIVYVNRRFTELTGYTRQEVIGKNPRILQSGNTPKEIYQQMWKVLLEGREWRGELQNKKKNGELYWESLTVSPVRNEQNFVTHFMGIEEDINVRKKLALELERTLAELKESNKKLEGFNSIVAHDLQGPLSNIKNAIDLAVDSFGDSMKEECAQLLTIAQRAVGKAIGFVKELLQYSRSNHQSSVRDEVSMTEIFALVQDDLRAQIKETQASIDIGTMPMVAGNKLLLTQMCQNLIDNALKYRREVPPHIEIRAAEQDTDWLFTIKDNGIGIPREEAENIFQPFYRIALSSDRPGTGIGLATCKTVINLHGGKIWVESDPGCGTTFYFTLPKNPA